MGKMRTYCPFLLVWSGDVDKENGLMFAASLRQCDTTDVNALT